MDLTRQSGAAVNDRWASERGAALIMTLLVSTLLLIGGGALILTTSMSAGLAIDSTTEMQAYYSAEAGVNTTLNILRGNRESTLNPATFRNAVNNPTLSNWLNYNGNINGTAVVSLSDAPVMGYTVNISDPDNTAVANQPTRLLVNVTGYGPKGSSKRMEIMVNRYMFDFSPIATVLMRGNDDGTTDMSAFAIGNSNAKEYSGYDHANPSNSIPTFGVTHGGDFTMANNEINSAKPNTVSGVEKVKQFGNSALPSFLQSADAARTFLNTMQSTAVSNGRYYTSTPSDFGTSSNPKFTFVDGDCSLSDGAGLLIVTGRLTASGNVGFSGIILVLGEGVFQRNGGGNGDTYGAIVVAKFARTWPSSENGNPHNFLSPTYDMNGGGNSTTGYDSNEVDRALGAVGLSSQAIREY
jgi:hypothetical protein